MLDLHDFYILTIIFFALQLCKFVKDKNWIYAFLS